MYGFVPHCTEATLTASIAGKQMATIVSTSQLRITKGSIVHRMSARSFIRDYDEGVLAEDNLLNEIQKRDRKADIIKLSIEYSIVTSFTSFVAIEKRDESDKDIAYIPTIDKLVTEHSVDRLPYLGWEEPEPSTSEGGVHPDEHCTYSSRLLTFAD